MARNSGTIDKDENSATLHRKLDAILAILLRQLNDEGIGKWNKQDKPNMVKMLINMGFKNPEISTVTGLAYSSVANIRSKLQESKSKRSKSRKGKSK